MSLAHKTVQMEFPLHRALVITVDEKNFFKDGGTLPARGTMYSDPAWRTFFGPDYKKEFSDYFYCWNIEDGKEGGTLLFSRIPPTLNEQAEYNFEYVIDGADAGDKWPRLMQRFYLLRENWSGASPVPDTIYQKGMAVPWPPSETGTGWVRTGEKEVAPEDKRIQSVFVVFEVYYSATSQERTDYDFDPETGTLITTVNSWVAPTDIPVFEQGKDKSQKQISSLWSLRTVSTAADFSGYHLQLATRVSLAIPDELVSVEIKWAEDYGESTSASDWEGDAYGNFTLSGAESGTAQSSASLIPDIIPTIKSYWSKNLPATTHFFILQSTNVTEADILSFLGGGILSWPVFKPTSNTISLTGGKKTIQVSASANANSSLSSSGTSYSKTEGEGLGFDVSSTHATRNLPPTIHDDITFTGGATKDIGMAAEAGIGWTGTGGFPSVAISNVQTSTLSGEVSPVFLAATSPAAIPTSGLYLTEYTARPFQKWFGFMMVQAEVFDASVLG